MSATLLRVGVFGGAFDPPHLGHVELARAAVAQWDLQRLYIVPTGFPAHKTRTLTPSHHRLAMCTLAFADLAQACVDSRETQRSGPSYTVDTLESLQGEHPGVQFYLLVGQDQAQALQHWHRPADLARLAIIGVAQRPDLVDAESALEGPRDADFDIQRLHMPAMAQSATDIRQRLEQHQNIETLVPASVARYIAHHHLYQTP